MLDNLISTTDLNTKLNKKQTKSQKVKMLITYQSHDLTEDCSVAPERSDYQYRARKTNPKRKLSLLSTKLLQ
jgi:hypothetical protein